MKNVLYIVDDHNMVRNGLKSWLEGLYSKISVKNREELIEKYSK